MTRIPFFIESVTSAQHANVQVCRKIMVTLLRERIAPLPLASNLKEVEDLLGSLQARGLEPAIFVVNTYMAEELLSQVDALIGQTPVVYLRRRIFSEPLLGNCASRLAHHSTTAILKKLTPRLNAQWAYGSGTANEVAANGAKALLRFLSEGNFAAMEDYALLQTYEMLKSRLDGDERPFHPVLNGIPHQAQAAAS